MVPYADMQHSSHDSGDGLPVLDYRIENGCVEYRILDRTTFDTDEWQRVTPEELSVHVMSNTVVAQWLRRRMDLHRLLRACQQRCPDNRVHHAEQLAA